MLRPAPGPFDIFSFFCYLISAVEAGLDIFLIGFLGVMKVLLRKQDDRLKF